ncbi:MAG: hypothetical protein ACK502_10575 [Alphaproteobacteria bacterium]
MEAIHARKMEKEVRTGLSLLPVLIKNCSFNNYRAAVQASPDCPAKQLLLKAFERCPVDNVLAFIAVAQIAHDHRIPFDGTMAMTLKDADGQPAFFGICEELQPTQRPDTRGRIHDVSRRMLLKAAVGGIFGFTVAKEFGDGGWIKTNAAGENDVDEAKLARAAVEVIGAVASVNAADKDLAAITVEKVMRVITPFLDKELAKGRNGQGGVGR